MKGELSAYDFWGNAYSKDFPETLYVNPSLITDGSGKASLSVDMADSITEWRVSTLAHSLGGKLGGGVSGIKVFQDFFSDVSFPATLTRGDEIDFPIAVYNYSSTIQDVKLELVPGSWYTALAATTTSVLVQPGAVVGVRFPVRVETVGLQTLTVKATGTSASDAVARKVLVVPDGKAFPTSVSGALASGSVQHSVSFPSNAVPGSPELYVELYPAFLQLGSNEDGYTLGLVANAFAAAAPNDPMTFSLLATLDAKKKVDGKKISWDSEGTQTNFYGAGDDAAITTTALVAHAMLATGGYKSSIDGALEYLVASKDTNGNFGSTQATIWTLRTLILAAEKGTQGAVGSLSVGVDGVPFTTVNLTADKPDVMTTVDLTTLATVGSHQVSLAFVGTGRVSYNLVSRHHLPWSQVPPEPSGPLSVTISYDKTALALNDTALATVDVTNNTPSVQNMVIVTLGIPPGFAVQTDDLDAYKTSGLISSYELTAKQLTLYLSELPASATETFKYRLLATMPVKASDGGAAAYLYYEPEKKTAAPATTIEVTGG